MQPNAQSYTPILRRWPCAATLLELCRHLKASVIHFNSFVSCLEWRWRLAIEALQQLKTKSLEPSVASFNGSMSRGAWQFALGPLRFHRSNVVSFTAIMGHTHWSSASYLLAELSRQSIKPNVLSFTSCISSCEDHWTRALQLLSLSPYMLPGCNAAMSAMEKAGRWQQAIELLPWAALNGLRADVVSLNAAVSACGGAAWNRALSLLNELGGQLQLDIITMNAAISAAEKNQLWELALLLLAKAIRARRSDESATQVKP